MSYRWHTSAAALALAASTVHAGVETQEIEYAWNVADGNAMAILKYADLRTAADPRSDLLGFMESAYQAGARNAGWNIDELTTPPLKEV